MPNINDLFDSFPDYDVFSDRTTDSNKPRQKLKKPRVTKASDSLHKNEQRSNTDYGDGYGIYIEEPKKKQNFMTVFFFPIVILWLEITLRLSCQEHLITSSLLYIFMFTIPFASIFTLICTFSSQRVNRILCNIILFILTIWYCVQIIYYDSFNTFLAVSSVSNANKLSGFFNMFIDSVINKKLYIIIAFVPILFNIIVGKHIFRFKKIRIPAKISLILVAVLFQLFSITAIAFSKNSPSPLSSYSVYYGEFHQNNIQEKFGLLTMQRIDILRLI